MKFFKSLRYLFLVSILAIFFVFTVFRYLRSQAQNKVYSTFSHNWLNSSRPWLVLKLGTLPQVFPLDSALDSKLKGLAEKRWVAWFSAPLISTKPVNDYGKSSLQTIRQIVSSYPNNFFVFYFERHGPFLKDEMKTELAELEENQNFALASREDGFIRELRTEHPAWSFIMGESTTTQLFMLASLYLEPLTKLKGDIVLLPAAMSQDGQINKRILIEVHRQKKYVAMNDPANAEIAIKFLDEGADAIFSEDQELLSQVSSQLKNR